MINEVQPPTSQLRKYDDITYNYKYIWLISLAAALGGFLFGYDGW
jgi:hypothetical protein